MNSGTRRIKTVTLFLIVFLYVISVSLGQEKEKNNNPEDEEEKVPNFQRKVSGLIQKLMNSKYVRTPKLQRRLARIDETLNDNTSLSGQSTTLYTSVVYLFSLYGAGWQPYSPPGGGRVQDS